MDSKTRGQKGKCGHPEQKQAKGIGCGCDSHQNTVCLRVSQLEGVAASATRLNTLRKKRMTGNLSSKRLNVKKTTLERGSLRQNEQRNEAAVRFTKMSATKGLESPFSRVETRKGWLQQETQISVALIKGS
jgi:hypothetical protein